MQARLFDLYPATIRKLQRLRKEAEQDGEYRVAKRIHSIILCARGHTSGEISELLEAPRSKVSLWLSRYERENIEGLLEGHRSGRPSDLSVSDQTKLGDIIESGPVAYGFIGGVWTSPMITRVIEEEFGRRYHPGHVRKILHALHFSIQRPRRLLAKADPHALDRWHRFTYPTLKKKRNPRVRPSSLEMKRVSGKTQPSIKRGHAVDNSHRSLSPGREKASKSLG
jgi:transposase